jgi:hypothetical protein
MPKKASSKGVDHRSAVTGQYVKKSTATKSPKTHVTEKR